MSKTLMRGLTLLETIDLRGPMTVMELARDSGLDKSIVSRTVTALERDGWVARHGGKVEVGPRAALLGHTSQASRAVRRAEPLVHAIAGVTGLLTQAYGLIGTHAVVLASAGGRGVNAQAGLGSEVPLYVTAAGKTIAAQLEPGDLARRLPAEPFPDPTPQIRSLTGYPPVADSVLGNPEESLEPSAELAADRAQLERQLRELRQEGFARDNGELHPQVGCLAIAWPQPGLPAALAAMGPRSEVDGGETLIRTALRTAAAVGAEPDDIVASVAGLARSRVAR
jgi:DNA-binding IclR family transcriptional regulator